MPRRCSVCLNPAHETIDLAILQGIPFRTLADQYGLSKTALIRHRDRGHIAVTLRGAQEKKENDRAGAHYAEIRALLEKAQDYMNRAEWSGDLRVALQALKEARATLELLTQIEQVNELYKKIDELEGKVKK